MCTDTVWVAQYQDFFCLYYLAFLFLCSLKKQVMFPALISMSSFRISLKIGVLCFASLRKLRFLKENVQLLQSLDCKK